MWGVDGAQEQPSLWKRYFVFTACQGLRAEVSEIHTRPVCPV